jgi:hypothetical protein
MNFVCAKPKVTITDFMRYLCASLTIKKNVIIDLNSLVERIYKFKQTLDDDLQFLFEDIEFRESIDSVVSNDIVEGLNDLQTFGIIGKLNPTYEKIVVYLSEYDAEKILDQCDDEVKQVMLKLADIL